MRSTILAQGRFKISSYNLTNTPQYGMPAVALIEGVEAQPAVTAADLAGARRTRERRIGAPLQSDAGTGCLK